MESTIPHLEGGQMEIKISLNTMPYLIEMNHGFFKTNITLYKLCAFSVRNEDVTHWEWTSSSGMGIHLCGNDDVSHQWGCDSPGMHILTGNGDTPLWE